MTLTEVLIDIGSAIREKEGSTELIPATEMASRITAISTEMPTVRVYASENNVVQVYYSNTGSFVDLTTSGIDMQVTDCLVVGCVYTGMLIGGGELYIYWDNGTGEKMVSMFAKAAANKVDIFNILDVVGQTHYQSGTVFTNGDLLNITKIQVVYTPD